MTEFRWLRSGWRKERREFSVLVSLDPLLIESCPPGSLDHFLCPGSWESRELCPWCWIKPRSALPASRVPSWVSTSKSFPENLILLISPVTLIDLKQIKGFAWTLKRAFPPIHDSARAVQVSHAPLQRNGCNFAHDHEGEKRGDNIFWFKVNHSTK